MTSDQDDDAAQADTARPVPATEPKAAPVAKPVKTTYTLVGEYVTRAVTMHYISTAMADLYRKEREEHKADEAHLQGMLTRIMAQVKAAKASTDKLAGEAFDKKPALGPEDVF
jgi:hypothetical protein